MVLTASSPYEVERIHRRLAGLTLTDAVAALTSLSRDPFFWHWQVQPLLQEELQSRDVYVARTIGTQRDSAVLQLFVWPPGASTAIHDHASWGALRTFVGTLAEERYYRLDNGTQPDTARLRKAWTRQWTCLDGVSTFLPYEDGIHRVSNPTDQVVISAHIYGPRLHLFDGRDYDPLRDYVCDRFEA